MAPPTMRPWNLALRFGLEIAALTGIGLASWASTDGAVRTVAIIAAPLTAAALWATFNVHDDPSRSGRAPVEVTGRTRLAIEVSMLGTGCVAYGIAGYPIASAGLAALTCAHYVVSRARVRWLLSQDTSVRRERRAL